MTSPSVRRTSRSTPWVLGCCGPMLTSISSVRTSNSMTVGSGVVAIRGSVKVAIIISGFATLRRSVQVPHASAKRRETGLSPANPVVLQRELVVLPQRVPDPVFGQQDPRRVRVPHEPHPAQVVHLALVPVG